MTTRHLALGGALLMINAGASGATERFDLEIAAGKAHEQCFALPQGKGVAWSFEASAPLRFNLHRHDGDTVIYPVGPLTAAAHTGQAIADATADYCLMWENTGSAAVRLHGARRPAG